MGGWIFTNERGERKWSIGNVKNAGTPSRPRNRPRNVPPVKRSASSWMFHVISLSAVRQVPTRDCDSGIKGSRKNKFTFLALRFRLGLVDLKEQKAL
jgi:hypothetical protein